MQTLEFQRSFETVHGGVATAHRLQGLPGKLSGCIYRSDLTKVHLSERFGGFMGDYIESDNAERLEAAPAPRKLEGRGLYLGHYMGGHYGHFITETLSTFWILEEQPAERFDYVLFHPFVFGIEIPGYAEFCLQRFGIDPKKVVFVGDEPLAFDEMVVPERLFRLNHSADPRVRWVYRHIAEGCRAPATPASRLYLSRRRFSRGNFERVIANEVDMEAEFRRRGFKILYPETMGFEDQVGHYAHADWIAGISGSGLHNSLFMGDDTHLIELGDPRYGGEPAPTQALCNHISGVDAHFIPFRGPRFGPRGTMLFDMGFLGDHLDIVDRAPHAEGPGARGFLQWALDRLEVLYLSIRPSAGVIARRLIGLTKASSSVT
jgi:Glycosyltransferase 61